MVVVYWHASCDIGQSQLFFFFGINDVHEIQHVDTAVCVAYEDEGCSQKVPEKSLYTTKSELSQHHNSLG